MGKDRTEILEETGTGKKIKVNVTSTGKLVHLRSCPKETFAILRRRARRKKKIDIRTLHCSAIQY